MKQHLSELISEQNQQLFPFVQDKLLVDFINGLEAAADLNARMQARSAFRHRFLDGLSGKNHRGQANLNDHFMTGLNACRSWLGELSGDINAHGVAISKIHDALARSNHRLSSVTHYLADVKEQLDDLADFVSIQFHDVGVELARLDRETRADQQLQQLMAKWEAGGLDALSPIGRCYMTLDNLYWGAFGERVQLNQGRTAEFFEHLANVLMIRLKADLNVDKDERTLRSVWLQHPAHEADVEVLEVLQYQGDWALPPPTGDHTVFLATQWPVLSHQEQSRYDMALPHRPSIHMVAQQMIKEVFDRRQYV